jgi:UDP-N-acetylmuramoyl-L-alanyl-D-glutamate--2,6-diaminopimelate ligase
MSQDISHGVALDELFPAARKAGPAGVVVQQCTSDWRQVRPGDAFVAVLGDEADGHDHVLQAVKRGAKALVVEQLVPVFNVPVFVVEDSRAAYGELCHALAGHPSRQMRVVGVVGDQGKSTVIALLDRSSPSRVAR